MEIESIEQDHEQLDPYKLEPSLSPVSDQPQLFPENPVQSKRETWISGENDYLKLFESFIYDDTN